jgi:lysozyme
MAIKGVDFSHWQARVNCQKLAKAGIKFAFVKAGEVHIKNAAKPAVDDDMHDRNIAELKAAGIICGDYYYYHPSIGASKQARHYAAIRARNEPDLPPVIDIEDSDALKPAEVARQLLAFYQEIVNRTGRQPIIYSRNGFLVNNCGNPAWPAGTLFWIARYSTTIGDLSPRIKPGVIIWQYTDKLRLPGCPLMDGNVWMAPESDLDRLAKGKRIMHKPELITALWRINL